MKKVMIGLVLIASFCSAQAAHWVRYADSNEIIGLYDPSTITENYNNGIVKIVWVKHINNDGTYSMMLNEYHCDSKMYRVTSVNMYYQNNSVIGSVSNPDEPWAYLPPGTVGMSLLKIVCPKSNKQK